ncbi:hypothetical protein K438DRAFT_25041 [Mycena galopus ATCC 62051]|nr:hypothetical protein K438DRAFT_25041 [Mycena galopus ATCC 62051]
MLEVYSRDALASLPWGPECNCLRSQLAASVTLHVLYELVVPPWPLLHWVAFRTATTGSDLQIFLNIIRGTDQDLFAWDAHDNSEFCQVLRKDHMRLTLYPQYWSQLILEIPLKIWQEIRNMTETEDRPRCPDDLSIRITAVLLKYSATSSSIENILAPLDVSFEWPFPLIVMAYVTNENSGEQSRLTRFDSVEFWAGLSLDVEQWLLTQRENLCRSIWNSPLSALRSSILARVQTMHVVLNTLPQNLTMYAHSLRLQLLP